MTRKITALAAALTLTGTMLAACSNDIGPSQKAPGPMGSTETPSTADLPAKNSQSTPIVRPE